MIKPEAVKEWIYHHDEQTKFGVVKFVDADGKATFQLMCADALRYEPNPPAYFEKIARELRAVQIEFVAYKLSSKEAEAWLASKTI